MKTAIMQPYFFPYIGYWQLMNAVDTFVILDDVNFIMRGWINRNNILLNGKAHLFSIPLDKPSQNKLISEVRLKFGAREKETLLKTIRQAYKKAPYFNEFYPILEETVLFENDDLTEFIHNSFTKTCDYLGLQTKFLLSSEIEKDTSLTGQDRIMEICKKLNTTLYINPVGGRDLYDRRAFEAEKMQLRFVDTDFEKTHYEQFKHDFIPNLSFIDVLMFNSRPEINRLLNCCALAD